MSDMFNYVNPIANFVRSIRRLVNENFTMEVPWNDDLGQDFKTVHSVVKGLQNSGLHVDVIQGEDLKVLKLVVSWKVEG